MPGPCTAGSMVPEPASSVSLGLGSLVPEGCSEEPLLLAKSFSVLICALRSVMSFCSWSTCSTRCSTRSAVSEVTVAVRFTRTFVTSRYPEKATIRHTAKPPSHVRRAACLLVCLAMIPPSVFNFRV